MDVTQNRAILCVSFEQLDVLVTGNRSLTIRSPVPSDAKALRYRECFERCALEIIYAHPDFEATLEGSMLPLLKPLVIEELTEETEELTKDKNSLLDNRK